MFKKNLLPIVMMSIFFVAMTVFGQESEKTFNIGTLGIGTFGTILIRITQICLMIWFVFKLVGVFIQRDKEHNWWALVIIPIAAAMLSHVGDIVYAISNAFHSKNGNVFILGLYYSCLIFGVLVILKSMYKWFFDKN